MEPWLVPIRSNMRKVYNKPMILQKMEKTEQIELVSLAHFRGRTFDIRTEENLNEIISNVDSTIIVTAHDEFKKLEISLFTQMKTPVLVDTRGIIDPAIAKQNQLIFRGLGRGYS